MMSFKLRSYRIFSLCFLISASVLAQKPITVPKSLDSLEQFLKIKPVDSLYALAMKDCAFNLIIKGKYERADSLLKQLELLKKTIPNRRIPYFIPFLKATLAYHQENDIECLENFINAMRVIEANPSHFKPASFEAAYNNVAAGFSRIDQPDSVMHYCLKAIRVQEQYNVKNHSPYISIGSVLTKYRKYTQALPYYEKSLAISQADSNYVGMGITENHLGTLYDFMDNTKEAMAHYQSGLTYAERANYPLLQTDLLVNLGLISVKEKNFKIAEQYFKRGEKLCRELKNDGALKTNLHNQGEMYRELEAYSLAEQYYLEALALAEKSEDYDDLYTAHQALAELYVDTNKFDKACDFFKLASVDKDSIFQTKTSDKVQELLLTYETEKKQQQIALLNQQNLVQSLQLSVQRRNEILMLLGIGALGVTVGVAYRRYRLRSQLEMEKVRSSIAADFHDELGANLSSIALYSDILMQNKGDDSPKSTPLLENINQNARQTLSSISDLIWTIKPDNDVLEGTLIRMKEYSIPLMEAKNIAFEFHIDEALRHAELDMTIRKSLYMVFKEGINNAIKYADASRITVSLTQADRKIRLEISDNGKGFDQKLVRLGNGLGNMQKRASEIKGELTIATLPGNGTTLCLIFKSA
jgi:signal transduction histidine kinase